MKSKRFYSNCQKITALLFLRSRTERIARYNKTLNIQWALDIKAQFPEDGVVERRSDNLEGWIGDIEDEDDRAQIELWANKVNKGKMTEEEFGEKVRGL